jgi:hypothetical protein
VVENVDHGPSERNSLAEADQDVAQQQAFQFRIEPVDHSDQTEALLRQGGCLLRKAGLDEQRGAGKHDRNHHPDPDAFDYAKSVEQNTAHHGSDDHGDTPDERLYAMPIAHLIECLPDCACERFHSSGAIDVHEHDPGVVVKKMVVERCYGQPAVENRRHDRIHLVGKPVMRSMALF